MSGNGVDSKDVPASFTIDGGVGSIAWTMAEIVDAAAGLARTAQIMDPLLDRLRNERIWLAEACASATSVPSAVLDALVLAEWRCAAVQAAVAKLAHNASQAAVNYAAAEARSAQANAALSRLLALRDGWLTWLAGPLAPLKSAAEFIQWLDQVRDEGIRNATEEVLRSGGAYVSGALGPGPALIYVLQGLRGQGTAGIGGKPPFLLRTLLDHANLTRPGTLSVRAVPVQEWGGAGLVRPLQSPAAGPLAVAPAGQPWNMEATFQSVLAGSNDAYSYPPGSIGVVQIPRPDGSKVWVVHLPGTEDWSTLDSSNPFDMEGNLEALTAAHQARFRQQEVIVQELIMAALQAAGALPGEDVLLTGHSGGGIHAAAAAASPAFLATVNVRMIVIAGAPAGNAQVPAGIAVVGLENEHDLVTAADFHTPPAHKNWVTATSHRPAVTGGAVEVVKQAHSMENYLHDAALLDHSDDPAVRAAKQTLEKLLGVGAAGAAVAGGKWVFQGKDNAKHLQRTRPGSSAPVRGKDYVSGGR
ncbi:hypothetical protein ACFUCV_11235 [Specibacter sp. NPDC057265]|uniref:hypothetical protein n=1 Tax=Specibacter sp. NPDC057265 TaxID=3346075 RepID=UPI00362709DF